MYPKCRISVDGKDVSGAFMERLISCEVTDADGVTSDTVSIELHDFPPAAIPRKGGIIRVWMGYKDGPMDFMGTFTADQIRVKVLPYTMSISGKGADLRGGNAKGDAKTPKDRNWDDKTLGDIVTEIAGELSIKPKIDAAIGAFKYDWLGQLGESNLELLERLASDHDALFSIKDGNLVFAARGTGKNAQGTPLSAVRITKDRLIVGSCEVTYSDRTEVEGVTAKFYDTNTATLETVEETV